jgi:hypothetical protein
MTTRLNKKPLTLNKKFEKVSKIFSIQQCQTLMLDKKAEPPGKK